MLGPYPDHGRMVAPDRHPTAEGYVHELGVYASDEEFGDLACPFALGAIAAGEPVLFAYDPRKTRQLRHWLPAHPDITYLADSRPYATPAKALVAWRRLVERELGAGAPRVRIAGDVPHPGCGRPFAGWDRYEVAIDRVLGDLPVWATCLYDARSAPVEVIATATRRHHHLVDVSGRHRQNADFDPGGRLADFLAPPLGVLETTTPPIELTDPTPAVARAAVSHMTSGLLGAGEQEDLILAKSEVVANAMLHGKPPLSVRIWAVERRAVVHVHDKGSGPAEPLAGLLPVEEGVGSGRGLWLTHQLDIDVALITSDDGFTVRLCAG